LKEYCDVWPPPNNGMHPTANSAAFIRKTWRRALDARRVMPGVRLLVMMTVLKRIFGHKVRGWRTTTFWLAAGRRLSPIAYACS
jgi:hypothetical protein